MRGLPRINVGGRRVKGVREKLGSYLYVELHEIGGNRPAGGSVHEVHQPDVNTAATRLHADEQVVEVQIPVHAARTNLAEDRLADPVLQILNGTACIRQAANIFPKLVEPVGIIWPEQRGDAGNFLSKGVPTPIVQDFAWTGQRRARAAPCVSAGPEGRAAGPGAPGSSTRSPDTHS